MYLLSHPVRSFCSVFFFFNDTATTEIYTLSLHDALPICASSIRRIAWTTSSFVGTAAWRMRQGNESRSEEHTSELQSQSNLVCRLLLEKKKKAKERAADTTQNDGQHQHGWRLAALDDRPS